MTKGKVKKMTSRELLKSALNHKKGYPVPIEFDATAVTGMHISCVAALRDYYGLEKRPIKVHEPYQMLGMIEEDLKQAIGIDVEGVAGKNNLFGFPNENWKEWSTSDGLEVLVPEKFNTTVDEKGYTYIYPEGDFTAPPSGCMPLGGYYFDAIVRQDDFEEDELNVKNNLEEFKILTKTDSAYFKNKLDAAGTTGRGVVASFGGMGLGDIALVPGTFMKYPKGIRDIEEWYISIVLRPNYIKELFEAQTDIAIENLKMLYKAVGNSLDVAFICGTDFGTQTGTFCSINTYREIYKPYYKKMNNWIHKNTKWKTFKHCCGAIETFLEEFIESGFDIINPVQCSAKGMDPALLKKKYGDKLTFWGGGIDTQHLLPFGSPNDVKQQTLERCRIFSESGGYVFNAIHNVQVKTPVENIIAMIETVKKFNKG